MRHPHVARVLPTALAALAIILIGDRAGAQSGPDAPRPWSCLTASAAEGSRLRPETDPDVCGGIHAATPAIRLGARVRTREASPLVAPAAPTALVAAVSGSNVALTWTAPSGGDPVTSYIVEAGSASGLVNLANADTGSPTPSLTATDVGAGTYFVRVRARNSAGTSAPSNEIIVIVAGPCATVPNPPSALGASIAGDAVTLTWLAPTGGCAPTQYIIFAGSAPGLSDLAQVWTGNTATTFSATGVGGGLYYVEVSSVNAGGVSGPSNRIVFSIGGCSGAPSAPATLSAQISGTTVVLSWAASSGSPQSYVLEAGSSPGATDIVVSDTGSTATTLTANAAPGTYYVRVRAKSACGQSAPSNEIVVIVGGSGTSCATISPGAQTLGSDAALGSVAVTAASSCTWTAVSNASFITVTSGSSGSGSGTVNYSVSANTTGASRTGTITIANLTFTVTQQLCSFTLSPPTMLVADAGGNFTIGMSTSSACTWTAASNAPFISVTSPSVSSGSDSIAINVATNAGAGRGGTLTIAGQTATVVQTGPSGFPNCGASIMYGIGASTNQITLNAGGGTGELRFSAPADCAWQASATVPWVSVYSTSPTNQPFGLGAGHFGYSVGANTTGAQRVGTIVGGGGTFTITQTACTFDVSPSSATVTASGATGAINVTTSCTDAWTATSNASFITIVGPSGGTGSGSVTVSIAANSGPTRSGTLTIAGQTVTITQQAP